MILLIETPASTTLPLLIGDMRYSATAKQPLAVGAKHTKKIHVDKSQCPMKTVDNVFMLVVFFSVSLDK